jgi:hypothetical protein
MVVNNIEYSSQTSRIDRGNIVYTDGIRNIAQPHLYHGNGGCYIVESDTLALVRVQVLNTILLLIKYTSGLSGHLGCHVA